MDRFKLRGLDSYDDEAMLSELRRVAEVFANAPFTQAQFDQEAKVSSSAVRRRFGGWRKALERTGLERCYVGGTLFAPSDGHSQKFSNEELLDDLREVATQLGRTTVKAAEFAQHSKTRANPATLARRFGSWQRAVQRAGLSVSKLGRRYAMEDYFENLLAVWTHYGRQPTYSEMSLPPSRIAAGSYEKQWGTWRRALRQFVDHAEASDQTFSDDAAKRPRRRRIASALNTQAKCPRSDLIDARPISIGLRYRVLARDRFRCVACGDSPAGNLNCQLHVDHLIPRAKGGRTVIENLRSLCGRCNLGKGALVIESSNL